MMRAMFTQGIRRVVLCVLIAAALPAHADAPVLRMEALTWTEVRDLVRDGRTTVIVPIGGTEQNGPHMALGKHNRRVALLAEKVAAGLGTALVAPVIAYVPEGDIEPPTSHMRFPGTVSVPSETFVRVLEAAAASYRRHGFRTVAFLGDHGGYQRDLQRAADRINQAWSKSPARAHAVPEYYEAVATAYPDWLRKHGFAAAEIGTHAGLADTSLMLALDPALVRVDRLHAASAPHGGDGIYGDPRRSSAELGRAGVELIVARTVAALRRAEARP